MGAETGLSLGTAMKVLRTILVLSPMVSTLDRGYALTSVKQAGDGDYSVGGS